MKQQTWFERITFFAVVSSVALSAACSRGAVEAPAPETKTAVPTNAEAAAPTGRITFNAATASSGPDSAAFVFDRDLQKAWNSGNFAPAWIQLDLGQPTTISTVRLFTAQTPPGPTKHEVLGGLTPDNLTSLGMLEGNTADSQWLELQVKGQVRYVKVVTLKSPSWVGWREIEVYR